MYSIKEKDGVNFITLDEFNKLPFIKFAYSTKVGGVSKAANPDESYGGLNLGFATLDNKDNIKENYNIFCRASDIEINDLVLSNQIHEDEIYKADKKDRGKGIFFESDIKGVDGLITSEKNTALTLFSADCVLIAVVDTEKKVIGACHAGWKGTVKGITKKLIEAMEKEYGTRSEDVIACICPGIGPCCFEVKNNVALEFERVFNHIDGIINYNNKNQDNEKSETININLWKANKEMLIAAGVLEDKIYTIDLCTSCNRELFYSYRIDGKGTGRMALIIELI